MLFSSKTFSDTFPFSEILATGTELLYLDNLLIRDDDEVTDWDETPEFDTKFDIFWSVTNDLFNPIVWFINLSVLELTKTGVEFKLVAGDNETTNEELIAYFAVLVNIGVVKLDLDEIPELDRELLTENAVLVTDFDSVEAAEASGVVLTINEIEFAIEVDPLYTLVVIDDVGRDEFFSNKGIPYNDDGVIESVIKLYGLKLGSAVGWVVFVGTLGVVLTVFMVFREFI